MSPRDVWLVFSSFFGVFFAPHKISDVGAMGHQIKAWSEENLHRDDMKKALS
jgi:hypothetical protein